MTTFQPSKSRNLGNDGIITTMTALVLGLGIIIAATAWLFAWLIDPSAVFVGAMMRPMAFSAVISVLVGVLIYWVGWSYSPSLRFSFPFLALIVGGLTLYNGWRAAELMFVDEIVLKDTAILLVFSTAIATLFSLVGVLRMSDALHRLTLTSGEIAEGNLSARVPVAGRDELARLSFAFNQMAEKLETAERERAEVEKLRRDLIAWVSHDLRTPLTSIRAMIEALNDGLIEDEAQKKRFYNTMLNDVMGLNTLINDLFELAQLDTGSLDFELFPASLSDLVSDTLASFQGVAVRRDIRFESDIDPTVDPITMNSEKIGRVLNNLISNGLKYTPDGGRIRVSAESSQFGTLVSVQDSGQGFIEEDLPRVFEKFYRGEDARSRDASQSGGAGAGLGLAIARGIIDGHKGWIKASNAAEGGAVISFWLPN